MSNAPQYPSFEEENRPEADSTAVLSSQKESTKFISHQESKEKMQEKAYSLGEVPQSHLLDPNVSLPLDSTSLNAEDVLGNTLTQVSFMIEGEIARIETLQKKIDFWEDRIEKNKAVIQKNQNQVKQNNTDIVYDKKNRDYWANRAEQVELDYHNAAASNREGDWAWIIKKYGLKNADGTQIDPKNICVDELCNGESSNLSGEYRGYASKYEQDKKNREMNNAYLLRESGKFIDENETLRNYVVHSYADEIDPLQDGVMLLKELGMKLKQLSNQERANYGQLREWAEAFLSDFIQANPKVSQELVTAFRKLTSIPLPARHN